MDVLSSRILVRPSDLDRSRRFYRDVLGLAIYREFGPPDDPGVVYRWGDLGKRSSGATRAQKRDGSKAAYLQSLSSAIRIGHLWPGLRHSVAPVARDVHS